MALHRVQPVEGGAAAKKQRPKAAWQTRKGEDPFLQPWCDAPVCFYGRGGHVRCPEERQQSESAAESRIVAWTIMMALELLLFFVHVPQAHTTNSVSTPRRRRYSPLLTPHPTPPDHPQLTQCNNMPAVSGCDGCVMYAGPGLCHAAVPHISMPDNHATLIPTGTPLPSSSSSSIFSPFPLPTASLDRLATSLASLTLCTFLLPATCLALLLHCTPLDTFHTFTPPLHTSTPPLHTSTYYPLDLSCSFLLVSRLRPFTRLFFITTLRPSTYQTIGRTDCRGSSDHAGHSARLPTWRRT